MSSDQPSSSHHSQLPGEEAELSSPSLRGPFSKEDYDLERKFSFSDQDDLMPPVALLSHQRSFTYDDIMDTIKNKPELSLFSEEEGIADMDLPDHMFIDELEYLDNITSCNKVENCLMLSEYEQNLIKETEGPPPSGRRSRKWSSLFRQTSSLHTEARPSEFNMTLGVGGVRQSSFCGELPLIHQQRRRSITNNNNPHLHQGGLREIPIFPNTARRWPYHGPKRSITVIEEASF